MEPPKRPYKITITVSGHDWDEMIKDLDNNVLFTIERHGKPTENWSSACGGTICGNSIEIEVDPKPVSVEEYFYQLDKYLGKDKPKLMTPADIGVVRGKSDYPYIDDADFEKNV